MRKLLSMRLLTLMAMLFSFLAPCALAVPAIPTIVVEIRLIDGAVSIEWGNHGTTDSYIVERRTGRSRWSVAGTFPGHAGGILNMAVQRRTNYSYRVRAVNESGTSAYSNIARVRTSPRTVPTTDGSYASAWLVPTSSGQLGAGSSNLAIIGPPPNWTGGSWSYGGSLSTGITAVSGSNYGAFEFDLFPTVTSGLEPVNLTVFPLSGNATVALTISPGGNVGLSSPYLGLSGVEIHENQYPQYVSYPGNTPGSTLPNGTFYVSDVLAAPRLTLLGDSTLLPAGTEIVASSTMVIKLTAPQWLFEAGSWTLDGIVGTSKLMLKPTVHDAVLANAPTPTP